MRHLRFPSDLDQGRFLARYWQKQPLLMPGAWPGFQTPISPDELAGLACEDAVESRLVLERGGRHPWEVRHGPFSESDFSRLPARDWTLLVQDVDKHLPQLAAILAPFRFIPGWRIDDLMVSYAPPGGSVGPHLDAYDVFLLQAHGRRRWRIAREGFDPEACIDGIDLRILQHFTPQQEWVLAPGDILYLPPGVAHHGVAVDDCMTFSIGFRTPRQYDLVHAWLEEVLAGTDPSRRYRDPDLQPRQRPGLIDAAALGKMRDLVRARIDGSDTAMNRWLGRFLTEPKEHLQVTPPEPPLSISAFLQRWHQHGLVQSSSACRWAYVEEAGGRVLFVDGTEHPLPESLAPLAGLLCDDRRVPADDATAQQPTAVALLRELYNLGCLDFGDHD
jgi:50S ribosomal protein L16 3-hydroxylase